MEFKEIIELSAAVATSTGVFFVVWQLWQTKKLALTSFEDQVACEYRLIARDIPASALLGKELQSDDERNKAREGIYNYIDLSNEQVFLRKIGRVSTETWEYWRDGIKSNLARPFFDKIWREVKEASPQYFQELCRLEREGFSSDPKRWE